MLLLIGAVATWVLGWGKLVTSKPARQLSAWSQGTIVPKAESCLLQRMHNRAIVEAKESKIKTMQIGWDADGPWRWCVFHGFVGDLRCWSSLYGACLVRLQELPAPHFGLAFCRLHHPFRVWPHHPSTTPSIADTIYWSLLSPYNLSLLLTEVSCVWMRHLCSCS